MREIIVAARHNVIRAVRNCVTGAAETETTHDRRSLDRLALRLRIRRDVREASATFMGLCLRLSCLLVPTRSLESAAPDSGVAVARATAEFGVINLVSTFTEPSLEETAATMDRPKIFPIYFRGAENWTDELIDRAGRCTPKRPISPSPRPGSTHECDRTSPNFFKSL